LVYEADSYSLCWQCVLLFILWHCQYLDDTESSDRMSDE
jgi:hypothetical protein